MCVVWLWFGECVCDHKYTFYIEMMGLHTIHVYTSKYIKMKNASYALRMGFVGYSFDRSGFFVFV